MAYNEPGSLPSFPPSPPPPPAPGEPVPHWTDAGSRPTVPPVTNNYGAPSQPPAWQQPQVARPTQVMPPSQPLFTPPPSEPKKSRGIMSLLLAGLLMIGLLIGGIAIGRSLNNSSQATVTDTALSQVESSDTEQQSTAVTEDSDEVAASATAGASADNETAADETEPEAVPVSQIDDADYSDEPVAKVAAAVAPSVVLLENGVGQGSGIIYDADGVIITNAHVVGDATLVKVRLPSGVRVDGEVQGRDLNTDIAVVKISDEHEFTPAVFAPDLSVQVGQLAVAIGSPFGLEQTVTAGIISAINRPVRADFEGETTAMLQTDAPINPGNSGGALADRQGRVVGMNTLIRTDGNAIGNIGVGFAIPADTMRYVADRLVAGEPVQSSFLGIQGNNAVAGDPGAVVTDVFADTPAENAGLLPDDRIVRFDGTPITSMSGLAAEVRLTPTDKVIVITVVRDGEEIDFELQLAVKGQ